MVSANVVDLECVKVEKGLDGIVHVFFKEGQRVDHRTHSYLRLACRKLSLSQVNKLMISFGDFIITEKRFWESCVIWEQVIQIEKTAIVAPTLAEKILARNYLYRCKPKNSFGIFDSPESAAKWLQK
jgi:hypothetical protein